MSDVSDVVAKGKQASWWYYGFELEPGSVVRGAYPDTLPMLPRILMRGVDVRGQDCLELGCMEGLIPAIWRRRGAGRVVAADAINHCTDKLAAVQAAFDAPFEFARVGLMYDLTSKLGGAGFDLINLSGLLYHVFSPLHVLAGLRPLLRKNGLMVISTPIHERRDMTMEYNAKGRLQKETNTFWYPSAPLFQEWIHSFRMRPIDCLYMPFDSAADVMPQIEGLATGYLSVLCRAVEDSHADDPWTESMRRQSWEYQTLTNVAVMQGQKTSSITHASERAGGGHLDLYAALSDERRRVRTASDLSDAHVLLRSHTA